MKPAERNVVREGKLFDVVVERGGNRPKREIVEHGGSLGVVALDWDGRIVLTRLRASAGSR